MSKRNISIDVLRVISIFTILIYHLYVVIGIPTGNKYVNYLFNIFGEIGVTSFFIISGVSIFLSLNKTTGKIKYKDFIKNRFKRILPEYYYCILICILITSSAVYLAKKHILNIFLHILLVHNLFPFSHGAINGVLWTMGVIFQFYLISKFIYKAMNKKPILTTVISIVITIILKYIIYSFIQVNEIGNEYFFIYGRQLFTSLDNFVLGMLIGVFITSKKDIKKWLKITLYILSIVFGAIAYISSYRYAVYYNGIFGYIWHTILAVSLTLFFISFSTINFKKGRIIGIVKFLSKYQYGIYLWHLVIIYAIVNNSSTIQNMILYKKYVVYIITFVITLFGSLVITYVFNKCLDYYRKKDTNFIDELKSELE